MRILERAATAVGLASSSSQAAQGPPSPHQHPVRFPGRARAQGRPPEFRGAGRRRAMLRLRGAESFRCRLVCATLSGRPVRIDGIREADERPGLRDYEASFLRLLEKISNGCLVEINETGAFRGEGERRRGRAEAHPGLGQAAQGEREGMEAGSEERASGDGLERCGCLPQTSGAAAGRAAFPPRRAG